VRIPAIVLGASLGLLMGAVRGTTATCTSHDAMVATVLGRDKKWHKMKSDGLSKNAFKEIGGAWLMKSNATVSDKVTLDGKPYNPTVEAGGTPVGEKGR
jgi:hypothetical protein